MIPFNGLCTVPGFGDRVCQARSLWVCYQAGHPVLCLGVLQIIVAFPQVALELILYQHKVDWLTCPMKEFGPVPFSWGDLGLPEPPDHPDRCTVCVYDICVCRWCANWTFVVSTFCSILLHKGHLQASFQEDNIHFNVQTAWQPAHAHTHTPHTDIIYIYTHTYVWVFQWVSVIN